MRTLKDKLYDKIQETRPRTKELLTKHGDVKIGDVTIAQAIGGMRGVKSLVTDISYLDPNEGIRYRGIKLLDVLEQLPKVPGEEMPYVEGLIYLLLTGDIPTNEEIKVVAEEFNQRKNVPKYVFDVLDAMDPDSHPMAMRKKIIINASTLCAIVSGTNTNGTKLGD